MGTIKSTRKVGQFSNEKVRERTGKTFEQWFAILDKAKPSTTNHTEKVRYLSQKYPKVSGWWLQMITATYEQERGLRDKYQTRSGYEISRSKTISVPVKTLYEACSDDSLRKCWLGEKGIVIRKATPRKSMRITWKDGTTILEVNFYPRGSDKSQIVVQHMKLASMTEAKRMQIYWSKRLDTLKSLLEK